MNKKKDKKILLFFKYLVSTKQHYIIHSDTQYECAD